MSTVVCGVWVHWHRHRHQLWHQHQPSRNGTSEWMNVTYWRNWMRQITANCIVGSFRRCCFCCVPFCSTLEIDCDGERTVRRDAWKWRRSEICVVFFNFERDFNHAESIISYWKSVQKILKRNAFIRIQFGIWNWMRWVGGRWFRRYGTKQVTCHRLKDGNCFLRNGFFCILESWLNWLVSIDVWRSACLMGGKTGLTKHQRRSRVSLCVTLEDAIQLWLSSSMKSNQNGK